MLNGYICNLNPTQEYFVLIVWKWLFIEDALHRSSLRLFLLVISSSSYFWGFHILFYRETQRLNYGAEAVDILHVHTDLTCMLFIMIISFLFWWGWWNNFVKFVNLSFRPTLLDLASSLTTKITVNSFFYPHFGLLLLIVDEVRQNTEEGFWSFFSFDTSWQE